MHDRARFTFRLPHDLKKIASETAQKRDLALNRLMLEALCKYIDRPLPTTNIGGIAAIHNGRESA
jgi:predicted transcriptional regulator